MLYAKSILPINTKPTRLTDHTATLIDYIYIQIVDKQNLLVLLLKRKPKVKLSPQKIPNRTFTQITGLLHQKRTLPNYLITSL